MRIYQAGLNLGLILRYHRLSSIDEGEEYPKFIEGMVNYVIRFTKQADHEGDEL